jgi:hypothetical protein
VRELAFQRQRMFDIFSRILMMVGSPRGVRAIDRTALERGGAPLNSKLTIELVREISSALQRGELASVIAGRYAVSVRTVYSIGAGERWGTKAIVRTAKVSPTARNELYAAHVRQGRTQRELAREAGLALGTLASALKDAAAVIGCHARKALLSGQPLPDSVRTLDLGEQKLSRLAREAPNEDELPKRLIREIRAA